MVKQTAAGSPNNASPGNASIITPGDNALLTKSDTVLERLTRLHPKVIDLSLGRIERLLARLDHPEQNLPPTIHIAGTNGKGSVIAFLRAILNAAGARVDCYTSPHLIRFHERIERDGQPIPEVDLVTLLETCEDASGDQPITFFEVTTAAAFLAFAHDPADILLLETGLGGRLDATNVLSRPALTIITPVSIDHVQFLGDSIEKIAFEKAGILKPAVPAVIGPQLPEALAVIEKQAAELGTPLHRFGREWHAEATKDGFDFRGRKGTRRYPTPALIGPHQIGNAATAIAAIELLDDFCPGVAAIDQGLIDQGLIQASWPGRLQRLSTGPLVALLPDENWALWLDGGHNAAAGQALADSLQHKSQTPLHLVYGMLNTKAAGDFLAPLAALATSLRAVAIPGEAASLSAADAAAEAEHCGLRATACPSVAAAIADIAAKEATGTVLICGSLYLAGTVLAENG